MKKEANTRKPPKFISDTTFVLRKLEANISPEILRKAQRDINDDYTVLDNILFRIHKGNYSSNSISLNSSKRRTCLSSHPSSRNALLKLSADCIEYNLWRTFLLELNANELDQPVLAKTNNFIETNDSFYEMAIPSSIRLNNKSQSLRSEDLDMVLCISGSISQKLKLYRNLDITRLKLLKRIICLQSKISSLQTIPTRSLLLLESPLEESKDSSMLNSHSRFLSKVTELQEYENLCRDYQRSEIELWDWVRNSPHHSFPVTATESVKPDHLASDNDTSNSVDAIVSGRKEEYQTAIIDNGDKYNEAQDDEEERAWQLLQREAKSMTDMLCALEEAANQMFLCHANTLFSPKMLQRAAGSVDRFIIGNIDVFLAENPQSPLSHQTGHSEENRSRHEDISKRVLEVLRMSQEREQEARALRSRNSVEARWLRNQWAVTPSDSRDALETLRHKHKELLKKTAAVIGPYSPFELITKVGKL